MQFRTNQGTLAQAAKSGDLSGLSSWPDSIGYDVVFPGMIPVEGTDNLYTYPNLDGMLFQRVKNRQHLLACGGSFITRESDGYMTALLGEQADHAHLTGEFPTRMRDVSQATVAAEGPLLDYRANVVDAPQDDLADADLHELGLTDPFVAVGWIGGMQSNKLGDTLTLHGSREPYRGLFFRQMSDVTAEVMAVVTKADTGRVELPFITASADFYPSRDSRSSGDASYMAEDITGYNAAGNKPLGYAIKQFSLGPCYKAIEGYLPAFLEEAGSDIRPYLEEAAREIVQREKTEGTEVLWNYGTQWSMADYRGLDRDGEEYGTHSTSPIDWRLERRSGLAGSVGHFLPVASSGTDFGGSSDTMVVHMGAYDQADPLWPRQFNPIVVSEDDPWFNTLRSLESEICLASAINDDGTFTPRVFSDLSDTGWPIISQPVTLVDAIREVVGHRKALADSVVSGVGPDYESYLEQENSSDPSLPEGTDFSIKDRASPHPVVDDFLNSPDGFPGLGLLLSCFEEIYDRAEDLVRDDF